jgi:Putative  PD-(D/E)XK family member, (DUF4420)
VIDDVQEMWGLLETAGPSADQLRVREVTSIELAAGPIFLGLDIHRYRHLLIPVAHNTRISTDRRSSGVQIVAHPLLDRGQLQPFVDLVCLKPHLHELFSILVSEVLDVLKKDHSRPDQVCRQVLDRWRELLEHEPGGTVGIEKLVGLFGELWFLREMVKRNPNAVRYWAGPRGARHDFSIGSLAVEVKSTLSRRGRFIEIHGHDQLEPPENGDLYLGVLKLEQESLTGESLPELVESIVQHGGDRYTLLQLLAQVDVRLLSFNDYKDLRFRLYERRIYEVNDAFPRITSRSFVGGVLPEGVISLAYQIDLSREPPEPLSESAVVTLLTELSSRMEAL